MIRQLSFFVLAVLSALLTISAAEKKACETGKAYPKSGAKANLTNVDDAGSCRIKCGQDENCHYFAYDTRTDDCWLVNGEKGPPQLEVSENAIAGPLACDLELAYASLEKAVAETESERGDRITGIVKKLCKVVINHGTGPEGVHRSIRATATQLQDATPSDLKAVEYEDIAEVLTAATELLSRRMHFSLEDEEKEGLILTRDDLDWIVSTSRTAKSMEGMSLHPEDVEHNRSIFRSNSSNCKDGKGCADRSFGVGSPWTNAQVMYCYDVRLARSALSALQCAMNQIRRVAPGIQFINVGYSSSGSCNSKPAIFMQSSERGCWADLGMSGGISNILGNQQLNLQTPGCNDCGTATHEILHAMGMAHEQARPDRDKYITIVWSNIKSGFSSQFDKQGGSDTSQPYDLGSIMHYGATSFSKNGRATIIPKNYRQSSRLGQRSGMSRADMGQLRALYECKPPSYGSCTPSGGGFNMLWIVAAGGAILLAVCCVVPMFLGSSTSSTRGGDRSLLLATGP
eukprot:symbB.v1.2.001444.t1/scaffold58.1/size370606/13